MKTIFSLIAFFFLPSIVFSQDFYMKCFYKNQRTPDLYLTAHDNVFDEFNRIPLIKESDTSGYLILKPSRVSFAKIGFDAVLVYPGEHVDGFFNGSDFEPHDSATINFKLKEISKGFSKIKNYYPVGGDFNKFKSVVGLLKHYIDSTNNGLSNHAQPWKDESITIALKEYLSARLAHFLVLPILFKNDYDQLELIGIIRKNVQIKYPEYWLQIESARIFLKTYYREIALPLAGFNLQKSLADKFFIFPPIRKLASYHYFLECMERGTVKTKNQLSGDLELAKSKLTLSKTEQEYMQDVQTAIQKIGEDISDVFGTLPLMNAQGKMLSTEEKKALIARPNIILDFWASWCIPCREKMSKLNSDKVTINHKQYQIIYLSIDEDQNKWKGAYFPFLNSKNSFRITDPNNQFVEDYKIRFVPRYMLIDQSGLISAEFTY